MYYVTSSWTLLVRARVSTAVQVGRPNLTAVLMGRERALCPAVAYRSPSPLAAAEPRRRWPDTLSHTHTIIRFSQSAAADSFVLVRSSFVLPFVARVWHAIYVLSV